MRWRWQAGLVLFLPFLLSQTTGRAVEYLVFTSFRGNGEDGLHLALSSDGYRWLAMKGDQSFLPPRVAARWNRFLRMATRT